MLAEISIEGYTAYRKVRGNFKEGKVGGVILYIRNEMVSYDHAELNKSESESVWCKLKIDNNSSVSFPIYVYLAAYNDIDQRQNIRITLLIQTCNFYMIHETTNCDNDTAGSYSSQCPGLLTSLGLGHVGRTMHIVTSPFSKRKFENSYTNNVYQFFKLKKIKFPEFVV